uniref:Uncharacterized protein n=1 Tax=Dicentrarchus labrax TaxID=13489 RepID=A0A8P4KK90_DICLA
MFTFSSLRTVCRPKATRQTFQVFVYSNREERQEACSWQGPLPDLLPQNEHPSWASPHHRAPREEAVERLEVSRVADQLRTIGDEFNATVLRRAVSGGTGQILSSFLYPLYPPLMSLSFYGFSFVIVDLYTH